MPSDIQTIFEKLRRHKTNISIALSADRIVLLEELVEKGAFRNRSEAITEAIDKLLSEHFSEIYRTNESLDVFSKQEVDNDA